MRTAEAPGLFLRACAVAVAVATALAVATAEAGSVHRVLAALAGPPLAALLAAAVVSHRRLLVPVAVTAALLFATAVSPRSAHLALAIPAFTAA
ncbi:MAG TPA: hypothetical protein VGH92_14675, partial [Gaiellaceae bacterium]